MTFVLVKKYKKNYDFRIRNAHIAIIEVFTLLIICFLNYYGTMQGEMNLVARIYAAIVDVVLLLFQFVLFNETRLQYENDVTNELLKVQGRQQQLSKESIETINIKVHDLKRQIAALRLMEMRRSATERSVSWRKRSTSMTRLSARGMRRSISS